MSTSNFTEKHVGTIALIVAIIALFGTLVPQITDFVAKSNKGKHYKNKKTEYVAFINFPTDEIVIVDIKKLSPLIDNTLPRKGNGEYVLLNKEEVKKLGNSIPIVK